jgi:excisionase family DNA binding protein
MPSNEFAAHIRVHPETVRRKLRSGAIHGIKVGSRWRIRRAELDRIEREGGL